MRFRPAGRAADRLRPAAGQTADALAADPVRLKALRRQCAADRQTVGEDACRAAAEAFRRRFFAGHTGPDEYESLAELPPIPPSFDAHRRHARRRRAAHLAGEHAMNDVTIIDRFLDTFSRYIDSGFRAATRRSGVSHRHAHRHRHDDRGPVLGHEPRHRPGRGRDRQAAAQVLYVGAFAYIIGNFNWLASIVFRSFAGLESRPPDRPSRWRIFFSRGGWRKPALTQEHRFWNRSGTWPGSRGVREHRPHRE